MNVSDLPAVKEASAPQGIFSVLASRSLVHPNKRAAHQVMESGVLDKNLVPLLRNARSMTVYERESYYIACSQIAATVKFSEVLVTRNAETDALTFGPYLVLDESVFNHRYLTQMIAHELGHLRNGDSYVKAALYLLGKGWVEEHVSPFGVNEQTSEERAKAAKERTKGLGYAYIRGGSKGVLIYIFTEMFQGVGSSARKFVQEMEAYFHKWDIEADKLATSWVSVLDYQAWLNDLRRRGWHVPFDASPTVRLEHSEQDYATDFGPIWVDRIPALWKLILLAVPVVLSALFVFGLLIIFVTPLIMNRPASTVQAGPAHPAFVLAPTPQPTLVFDEYRTAILEGFDLPSDTRMERLKEWPTWFNGVAPVYEEYSESVGTVKMRLTGALELLGDGTGTVITEPEKELPTSQGLREFYRFERQGQVYIYIQGANGQPGSTLFVKIN